MESPSSPSSPSVPLSSRHGSGSKLRQLGLRLASRLPASFAPDPSCSRNPRIRLPGSSRSLFQPPPSLPPALLPVRGRRLEPCVHAEAPSKLPVPFSLSPPSLSSPKFLSSPSFAQAPSCLSDNLRNPKPATLKAALSKLLTFSLPHALLPPFLSPSFTPSQFKAHGGRLEPCVRGRGSQQATSPSSRALVFSELCPSKLPAAPEAPSLLQAISQAPEHQAPYPGFLSPPASSWLRLPTASIQSFSALSAAELPSAAPRLRLRQTPGYTHPVPLGLSPRPGMASNFSCSASPLGLV